MDRDRSVPKLPRQEPVDPPTGQFDGARDWAKRESLAAGRKRRPGKDAERNPSETEGCERVVKGARILARICCMRGDWRKRLHGKPVWSRLRSYVEARFFPSGLWLWVSSL